MLGGTASAQTAAPPTLSATVIEGTSAYSPVDLFPVYRDQLGRPITSASAQAIVAQIEAMYSRDGYSRPEIRLDNALTGNGILRIEVYEAQITQVRVTGDAGPYAKKLDALSAALRESVPLRTRDMQLALQKIRALPGLSIRASTQRDPERQNGHVLAIEASFRRLDGVVEVNNRGTRESGPAFAVGQLVVNDLFGLGDRAGLVFSNALDYDEFAGGGFFADLPVGAGGTHFTTTLFASTSDPTERPQRDDVYERARASLRVTRPIEMGGSRQLALTFGLDFDDLVLERDAEALRREQLRVAELGVRFGGRAPANSQYLVAVQLRGGVDGLGSELYAADLDYDPRRTDFWLARAQLTYAVGLPRRWSARLDVLAQQSAYVLPDDERYRIGGERLGRGFEVAEIAGDRGIGAKVEVRRELTGAASDVGRTSAYGFYDFGAAWKQDLPGRESAATSGLGIAIEYRKLSGYLEVAKPLTHADVEGDRDTRVFAGLSLRL